MTATTFPYHNLITNTPNFTNQTPTTPAPNYDDVPLFLSIIYGSIATMSIGAIVDSLTGIVMFFTPSLIIGIRYYSFPTGIPGGAIFCHLVDSFFIFFSLGNLSVMLVMLISIERWAAVVRATKYSKWFALRRVKICIGIVIILVIILNLDNLLGKIYVPGVFPPCVWSPIFPKPSQNLTLFTVFEITRLFLPVLLIILCYVNIAKKTLFSHKVGGLTQEQSAKYIARRRVTTMCFVSSAALVVCWLPNEIYFVMMNFEIIDYSFIVHGVTKTLVIFNSCINPFIYAATNRAYRRSIFQFITRKHNYYKARTHRLTSIANTSNH
ncbi:uncharacterized protein TRIADDRAFT_52024 [Trichoplax adhaerens]|uniref:G-protein coupled receptors family 1 profile domain-containing protein n=1 Tax=Trichoplax adhaerens TaxID=10228 RepID=B3RLJ5_TRIAD|nr:hypothetical protein TRIADDRAFT_52024 [Trichoplax adhaerens]EDV28785.1 hypothetical protein TRIADDRAFT_52024 [Trichoplax adhaerens]|eukprot:XP_002107987.1 hypothetical protein TRIADDRAFT_52024 [Trichoplax adhaerens]